jgi:multiple sugar transport system substrate-binding protein
MGVTDRGVSRRTALLTFGGGAGAAFLAACGGATGGTSGAEPGTPAPGGKQAEIHVNFRQGSDSEWQQKLIPAFQEKNPNIKVTLDVLPGEPEYWAKVQALYATGQVGDMIWASLGNYKNFADKGLLGALDSVISRDKYDLKDYKPVAIDTMKWQGKLYGMPWGAHTGNPAVLYNADLLAAEGIKIEDAVKSYDALYEAAVKLTKGPAGNRTQFGFLPAGGQIGMNNHIRAYGGDFYDQKGEKLTLDQPPAQDAIKWMQQMWRDTAPTFGTGFNGDEFFANGRIALYQAWWGNQFTPGEGQIAGKFKWDIVRMPAGPKGVVGTQLTINGITMSSITKQPEATWTYIKYMLDPEVQVQIVLNNGGRPATRDAVLKNPDIVSKLKAPSVFVPLYDTAQGWPEPANHRWPEFNTAVDQVFGPIWTGAVALEAGMRDVNSKLQEILSKPKA